MRNIFEPLFKLFHGKNAGIVGAVVGFILGLLLVIFGFWRTIFILLCAAGGYVVGALVVKDKENFKDLLNKLFPPGKYR